MNEWIVLSEAIRDLLAVIRNQDKRRDLQAALVLFQEKGAVPRSVEQSIRALYKRYRAKIAALHESRERARISRAKESLKLNDSAIQRLRQKRMETIERQISDLGI